MFGSLRRLRHWVNARLHVSRPEPSCLIVGSTGSGKSEGELVDLVRLARRGDCAVVLLDGHGPLAFRAAGHLAARGHEARIVYEPLSATDRVLCWDMLPRSAAPTRSGRLIADAETRDELAQCFYAQRNLATLVEKPWTQEWLQAAVALCIAQPRPEPLASLLEAFRVGSPGYERLLRDCGEPEVVAKFRAMEQLKRRSLVQYELETGASRRLLEGVCGSEVVRLRCRPGTFDWLAALRQRRLIAFDGGGIRSRDLKRTLFLLVSLQVIHAVRRHFAETQAPLPVVLVLEEAGAMGLVAPFVISALQELRKAGLAIHLLTQSAVDFGDRDVFEALLANTPWQAWYQCLSPADQELGGKALANATFDPLAVHYTRPRTLADGPERVATVSHGEAVDPRTGATVRRERRTGMAVRTRYWNVTEATYKTPSVHEQEFRTALATLRIGERLVRDRYGVRRELVRPVRSPWLRPVPDEGTRALIERIRKQPIYQPCPPADPAQPASSPYSAAERLREPGHPSPERERALLAKMVESCQSNQGVPSEHRQGSDTSS
jgi:hypothetical protein